jgi:hypothetical protein
MAMKRVWLLLAVLLTANGAMCRADDPKPASIERKADDAAVKKDDGKDYVVPIDAKKAVTGPSACNASCITCSASVRCRFNGGTESFRKLWAWATYCPLKKSCLCDCCHKCNDCMPPPLYTYFLDPYHACAPAGGCTTYDKSDCVGCAHR